MNSNPNPFPWGIGWRAFFLGCSLGDRKKFEHTMEVCSNFSSIDDMHKEADAVKKATLHELKTLILDPAKGAMSVDVLCWAMNQADSGDARQWARWAKYRQYKAPQDQRATTYWSRTFRSPEADNDEVQMVARAPAVGDRARPIVLDEDDEEEKKMATPPPLDATPGSPRLDKKVCTPIPTPDVIEK